MGKGNIISLLCPSSLLTPLNHSDQVIKTKIINVLKVAGDRAQWEGVQMLILIQRTMNTGRTDNTILSNEV